VKLGRRFLLATLLLALLAAALQLTVGGVELALGGIRISNHSLTRPLIIAILASLLLGLQFRTGVGDDLSALDRLMDRTAPAAAAGAAIGALVVGMCWGTWAAGGSDSYCYIGQAEEFAAGRAVLREPLARKIPLERPDLVFAPVGFVPAAAGGAVPMCAPGLSLIMAPAWKIGGETGLHFVVPALGALAIWATYRIGRRVHSPTAGAMAAVLLAASPVFLYQIVQPMSDVPAAAFWTLALAVIARRDLRSCAVSGFLLSWALLIRPNLAPALLPILVFVALPTQGAGMVNRRVIGFRPFLYVGCGLMPGCALLAWLNQIRYGSPFRTGYGDVEMLFSLAHIAPNAARYWQWTMEAQTPLVLLAIAAPFVVRRERSAYVWMALAYVAVVIACYLPYTVFDAWWYTRFLLPALPIALALASAALVDLISRTRARGAIALLSTIALACGYVHYARSHSAFALRDFERRFIRTGTDVASTLPANAVVITIQESGAVRHYGRRPAALWDALAPDALDETVAQFEAAGLKPYLLLEDWEEAGFRERFATESLGKLDWRPAAEIRDHVTVRLYDPGDRVQ
jgi:hypothetical protein